MSKRIFSVSAISLAVSMAFANQVQAEEAAALAVQPTTEMPQAAARFSNETASAPNGDEERLLKEMVVSANKDKPVQQRTELGMLTKQTPLAGTVVGRSELETIRIVTALQELMRRVPGISMSRNMRFTDGGKNYTDNRTDGMRTRNTGTYSFVDQSNTGDIERVEFIRGPGSVLNSSYAIGGTINIISRNPPKERENEVTGEIMGDGGYRAGVTSGASISPNLGYFVNANRQDTTGWREHTAEKKDSFSTKWVVNPEDVSKLSFRIEYLHDDYQDPGTLSSEAQFNANWRQAQPGSFFRTDIKYTTPSLQYRRLFGEAGELDVYAQSRKTDSTAKTSVTGNINDNKATENNIQLLYKHSFDFAKTALTGGLDNMTTDSQTWGYVNNSAGSFEFVRGARSSNSISKERHQSPFLQYEFSPADPLRFSIGARNDNITYTVDDQINNLKDGSKSFSRLVKKAGATFNFDDENLIWVNIAEGFMAPSVGQMLGSNTATPATHAAAVSSSFVPTNMNLLPEDSLTKEIGLRGRLASGLSYDTDYYQTEFRNLIVSQNCGLTELCKTRNENAANAHASGIESVFGYELNKYLDLGLSHTYSRYQYDSYVTATANYTGLQRYWTPRNHYNFRVMLKPAEAWKAELEMDHISGYYTNQTNTDTYKRPDIYNLRVSYNSKSWSFWGHVLNLLNTKYMERLGSTDAGLRNSITSGYIPLTLRTGISYKF